MKKVKVILNVLHALMHNQDLAIRRKFNLPIELISVPDTGWNLDQMAEVADRLCDDNPVVFASPIPALIVILSRLRENKGVYVLHNDKRVAKEIRTSEGTVKVIHTVAPDGWEIV